MMNWLPQTIGAFVFLVLAAGMFWFYRTHVANLMDARTTGQKRNLLVQLGKEAFVYAETAYQGFDGPAKLNEAIKYVLDKADSACVEADLQEVRAAIETAWLADKRQSGTPIRIDSPKVYETR